nr:MULTISPECIES: AAA family ATPase [unclassified Rhodococcus (in: high G+C Gram-positive bacteria)]
MPYGRDYPDAHDPHAAPSLHVVPNESEPENISARLWPAKDLQGSEQPKWLAQNRIPRAAISLLVGSEGIGKSLMWTWLAGLVTTGRAEPRFGIPARKPEHVFVVVTEDDWSSTVRPRLEVAGADLSMISVICTDADGSGAPTFPHDLHLIRESKTAPGLIVVDAWLDTVPTSMSVRDPQQARRALHPWKEIATTTGAAILLLTHTNRMASGNARDTYGGTGELRKKARMALFAQADPEVEGGLLIGPEKSNGARKVDATQFKITALPVFTPSEDDDGHVPLLKLVGDSTQTITEHLTDAFNDGGEDRSERVGAAMWLRDYIGVEGPSVPSKQVKDAARMAGHAERTLARARKELDVTISYEGVPAKTMWSLPA